mmetsp:Transcript_44970/g.139168  ORF Transcript_44970/g.139168 Transcript_44970/m.139168 type:complete len:80 (-) Transcript_44970:46-285(-)
MEPRTGPARLVGAKELTDETRDDRSDGAEEAPGKEAPLQAAMLQLPQRRLALLGARRHPAPPLRGAHAAQHSRPQPRQW